MFSYTAHKLYFKSFRSQELQIHLSVQDPCSKHLKCSSQEKEAAGSLLTVTQLKNGISVLKSLIRVTDLFLLWSFVESCYLFQQWIFF